MKSDGRTTGNPSESRGVNRVLIAGLKSHSGKTLVTCALLETLRRRKLDPASFKCGPDYIDPMFHERVLGIECKNLDTYFAGTDGVRRLVAECCRRYAVIEGVMGIYDGADVGGLAGSSYEIAAATSSPVILVVDASGIGRTALSLIRGILEDDSEHLIRGLILNRCPSGYYTRLKPVLATEFRKGGYNVRILGAIPTEEDIRLESRHLGLILPGEVEDIRDKIRRAADLLEEHVDVGGILELMREAGSGQSECRSAEDQESVPLQSVSDTCRRQSAFSAGRYLTLAVARDEAFCFYYKENLEMFRRRGVKIRWFSPLHDREIPEDADGLLLGGGYPENHLEELSRNRSMLESVRKAADRGLPSLAECGGFMYLHRTVEDMDGRRYETVGAVDGECRYAGHLVRFGYMEIEAVNEKEGPADQLPESLVGMRGHEFHYYDSTCNGNVCTAGKPYRDTKWNCIVAGNNGIWGFPHFYYGSDSRFVDRFISRMKKMADR